MGSATPVKYKSGDQAGVAARELVAWAGAVEESRRFAANHWSTHSTPMDVGGRVGKSFFTRLLLHVYLDL